MKKIYFPISIFVVVLVVFIFSAVISIQIIGKILQTESVLYNLNIFNSRSLKFTQNEFYFLKNTEGFESINQIANNFTDLPDNDYIESKKKLLKEWETLKQKIIAFRVDREFVAFDSNDPKAIEILYSRGEVYEASISLSTATEGTIITAQNYFEKQLKNVKYFLYTSYISCGLAFLTFIGLFVFNKYHIRDFNNDDFYDIITGTENELGLKRESEKIKRDPPFFSYSVLTFKLLISEESDKIITSKKFLKYLNEWKRDETKVFSVSPDFQSLGIFEDRINAYFTLISPNITKENLENKILDLGRLISARNLIINTDNALVDPKIYFDSVYFINYTNNSDAYSLYKECIRQLCSEKNIPPTVEKTQGELNA